MYQEDYNTIADLELSDEEENDNLPEKNLDPPQAEASHMPQEPSFGLAHLVSTDVQQEDSRTRNEIDHISFIMQTMGSFAPPPTSSSE
ncbi:hypothetical protein Lal_00022899 [Lupinus albus]|nr:hypothetical protein Lal_00022899 [Lupinus albus]